MRGAARYALHALAMATFALLFMAVIGGIYAWLYLLSQHLWIALGALWALALLAAGAVYVWDHRPRERWYVCLDPHCGYGTNYRPNIKNHAAVLGHHGWVER